MAQWLDVLILSVTVSGAVSTILCWLIVVRVSCVWHRLKYMPSLLRYSSASVIVLLAITSTVMCSMTMLYLNKLRIPVLFLSLSICNVSLFILSKLVMYAIFWGRLYWAFGGSTLRLSLSQIRLFELLFALTCFGYLCMLQDLVLGLCLGLTFDVMFSLLIIYFFVRQLWSLIANLATTHTSQAWDSSTIAQLAGPLDTSLTAATPITCSSPVDSSVMVPRNQSFNRVMGNNHRSTPTGGGGSGGCSTNFTPTTPSPTTPGRTTGGFLAPILMLGSVSDPAGRTRVKNSQESGKMNTTVDSTRNDSNQQKSKDTRTMMIDHEGESPEIALSPRHEEQMSNGFLPVYSHSSHPSSTATATETRSDDSTHPIQKDRRWSRTMSSGKVSSSVAKKEEEEEEEGHLREKQRRRGTIGDDSSEHSKRRVMIGRAGITGINAGDSRHRSAKKKKRRRRQRRRTATLSSTLPISSPEETPAAGSSSTIVATSSGLPSLKLDPQSSGQADSSALSSSAVHRRSVPTVVTHTMSTRSGVDFYDSPSLSSSSSTMSTNIRDSGHEDEVDYDTNEMDLPGGVTVMKVTRSQSEPRDAFVSSVTAAAAAGSASASSVAASSDTSQSPVRSPEPDQSALLQKMKKRKQRKQMRSPQVTVDDSLISATAAETGDDGKVGTTTTLAELTLGPQNYNLSPLSSGGIRLKLFGTSSTSTPSAASKASVAEMDPCELGLETGSGSTGSMGARKRIMSGMALRESSAMNSHNSSVLEIDDATFSEDTAEMFTRFACSSDTHTDIHRRRRHSGSSSTTTAVITPLQSARSSLKSEVDRMDMDICDDSEVGHKSDDHVFIEQSHEFDPSSVVVDATEERAEEEKEEGERMVKVVTVMVPPHSDCEDISPLSPNSSMSPVMITPLVKVSDDDQSGKMNDDGFVEIEHHHHHSDRTPDKSGVLMMGSDSENADEPSPHHILGHLYDPSSDFRQHLKISTTLASLAPGSATATPGSSAAEKHTISHSSEMPSSIGSSAEEEDLCGFMVEESTPGMHHSSQASAALSLSRAKSMPVKRERDEFIMTDSPSDYRVIEPPRLRAHHASHEVSGGMHIGRISSTTTSPLSMASLASLKQSSQRTGSSVIKFPGFLRSSGVRESVSMSQSHAALVKAATMSGSRDILLSSSLTGRRKSENVRSGRKSKNRKRRNSSYISKRNHKYRKDRDSVTEEEGLADGLEDDGIRGRKDGKQMSDDRERKKKKKKSIKQNGNGTSMDHASDEGDCISDAMLDDGDGGANGSNNHEKHGHSMDDDNKDDNHHNNDEDSKHSDIASKKASKKKSTLHIRNISISRTGADTFLTKDQIDLVQTMTRNTLFGSICVSVTVLFTTLMVLRLLESTNDWGCVKRDPWVWFEALGLFVYDIVASLCMFFNLGRVAKKEFDWLCNCCDYGCEWCGIVCTEQAIVRRHHRLANAFHSARMREEEAKKQQEWEDGFRLGLGDSANMSVHHHHHSGDASHGLGSAHYHGCQLDTINED